MTPLTGSTLGIAALGIFVLAYGLVVSEEIIGLRKSKPVIVAAGVIWLLVAIAYADAGRAAEAAQAVRHNLLEFAELM
ncbi:MAG: sodium:proton antiporter NhaD, partial [Gammaproteobacteria bacterium]